MKLKYLILLVMFSSFGQQLPNFNELDSLYREDQFYIGITYNALQDMPVGMSQKKFTPSFFAGILRDMPINKSRTIAIALGMGYSINNYNENLLVDETAGSKIYATIDPNVSYDRNKLILHYIDIPLEFRWRTSTAESHKFYRIYAGFKTSFLGYNYSKFVGTPKDIVLENNPDLNKIQYGTYINFGYNGWDFYVYYGLNPIFKSTIQNKELTNMRNLNFGFIFYIL